MGAEQPSWCPGHRVSTEASEGGRGLVSVGSQPDGIISEAGSGVVLEKSCVSSPARGPRGVPSGGADFLKGEAQACVVAVPGSVHP